MAFRRWTPWIVLLAPALGALRGLAAPAPKAPVAPAAAAPVDAAYFEREIQPILQKSCLGCHGVQARLSGLDLRSREAALKGGSKGPSFVAGSAAKSHLYQMVAGTRTPLMPPGGKLPAPEIAKLKRWLDAGAPWPEGKTETAREQVWWSFKTPVRPPVPKLPQATWVKTPIDAFVLQKLRANGLSPSPPAPRRVLIRRAYQAMIGLPPTPEEVQAFEADRSPDAWEKVVDRLLASPHYGERWGRHWLDLVRYADSSGFEGDKDRPLAYRYRDYVIRSFNADKPYDQFLKEQLAGDEIAPGDPEKLVATGYLACGIEDFAMVKLPTTRADELDDLVSTTTSSMLGLTVGCARCHDHKYDPVSQVDYYRLQAIFHPTERREVPIPTPEEKRAIEAREAEVQAEVAPLKAEMEPLVEKGRQAAQAAGHEKPSIEQLLQVLPEPERKTVVDLSARIKAAEAKRLPVPMALTVTDKQRTWEPVHLLLRGDAYHKGPVVQPGFIASLPGGKTDIPAEAATSNTTGRRKALAEWIASPRNPLTGRVWVNRIWRQHFGRGLVNSPSNFGINGELPSHPEMLDWLAVTFVSAKDEGGRMKDEKGDPLHPSSFIPQPSGMGWQLKPLHRMILLSSTWQQASAIRPEALAKDPQNRYVWRMPVRRLEGEPIRDSLLAVSGTLNREMFGPAVYPPVDPALRADTFQGPNWPEGEDTPATRRRSVYVKVKRSLIFPQLEVFDCPEITSAVAARNVTTTPLQALTMLNDPLVFRQSAHFAERLQKEAGAEPGRQVDRAYRLCFGRPPTAREAALALEFLKQPPTTKGRSRLADFCHSLFNLSEFVYVP